MENVWDYPRPPALLPCPRRVRIILGAETLADSTRALRVLETSHPPTIYVPAEDVAMDRLVLSPQARTLCEWKGVAHYLDGVVDGNRYPQIGWSYAQPAAPYLALQDHVSFYPGRVGEAWLGAERVHAQAGDFYGGWITAGITGPFKGAPGTAGW